MCFFGKQRYVAAIACLKKALYLDPFEACHPACLPIHPPTLHTRTHARTCARARRHAQWSEHRKQTHTNAPWRPTAGEAQCADMPSATVQWIISYNLGLVHLNTGQVLTP